MIARAEVSTRYTKWRTHSRASATSHLHACMLLAGACSSTGLCLSEKPAAPATAQLAGRVSVPMRRMGGLGARESQVAGLRELLGRPARHAPGCVGNEAACAVATFYSALRIASQNDGLFQHGLEACPHTLRGASSLLSTALRDAVQQILT